MATEEINLKIPNGKQTWSFERKPKENPKKTQSFLNCKLNILFACLLPEGTLVELFGLRRYFWRFVNKLENPRFC